MTHRPAQCMLVMVGWLAVVHAEAAEPRRPNEPTPQTQTVAPSKFYFHTYTVTDLVTPLPWSSSHQNDDWLINLIEQTVQPDTWQPRQGSISPVASQDSLVIRQTKEGHDQIEELLEQLRRQQGESIVIDVTFFRIPFGMAPSEERPTKTTGNPALRWQPTGATSTAPNVSNAHEIALPEISLLSGQTVTFTTPSDSEGGVSQWSVQALVSNDRRSVRLWLGDATNKVALATAWLSDGEPLIVGLPLETPPDSPGEVASPSRVEPMQRWLQLTPQLMTLQEEEEHVNDAQHRVARRPSPKSRPVHWMNAHFFPSGF